MCRCTPAKLHRVAGPCSLDHRIRRAGHDTETELRIDLAGADELVRVRLDAWRQPHEHAGRSSVFFVQVLEPFELVERVDDDRRAHLAGAAELVDTLVVAVQDEPLARRAGGRRDVQLSPRCHVEHHALVERELGHGATQERLRRVGDAIGEGRDRLSTAGAQVRLVVHEQRRAELARQFVRGTFADRQPAAFVDGGGVGQYMPRDGTRHRGLARARLHRLGRVDTPSNPSPMARPMRADSTSHSRACVSSTGMSSPIT